MHKIFIVLILLGWFQPVFSANFINILRNGFCISGHSCSGTACIPLKDVCNGVAECADGSDEANCAIEMECSPYYFLCKKTDGESMCLPDNLIDVIGLWCTGCGAPPIIDNGIITIDTTYNRSAIGAIGEVKCKKGFKSCTSLIRCLPSGTWTTASCQSQPEHE